MNESDFWAIVEPLGWGTVTTDSRAVKKALMGRFTPSEADGLEQAFSALSGRLYRVLDGVVEGVGDDSFSDLIAHIIGLGRAEYEAVLADPRKGAERARKGAYRESFHYCIPHASDYENLQIETYTTRAKEIAKVYEAIGKADEDDIPWLPKLRPDITKIVSVMVRFGNTGDVATLLNDEAEVRAGAERIGDKLRKLNAGYDGTGLDGLIHQGQNKWWIWNLFTDVRDYML